MRCFTFGDFHLSPMVEEFEEILGCPLGGRKPYLFSGFYPSLTRISKIVQISAQELDHKKQVGNGVVGIPRKYLEAKARILAGKGEWAPFIDILVQLIFRGVLFPNVDGLVGLAVIDAFLVYHDHKESPIVAMLADLYDTFDRRCEKSSTRIVCCTPTLYVWLVSHLFRQETNMETLQKAHKAWEVVQQKDKELRGSNNGPIGGYRKWLKAHVQGLDWLLSLRTAKREEVEAPEEDEKVQALRTKLKQAQTVKESNSELKLRREERDQSRVDSLILKDELKVCSRSKRNLSQRLCEIETNMLAIISKYQEELNLATAHEHSVADEYAQMYAEKEARGRVIDSLHQEATMWMD
ncbi:hypothetical protein HKD37_18G050609 [Glycine soja]